MRGNRHGKLGEAYRHRLGTVVAGLAGWLETLLAVVVLVALAASCIPTVREMVELFSNGSSALFHEFLGSVLNLVIGVEFIEMLTKHSPGSALEVLLFAIVRHMLIGHGEALDNLLSVMAIALIFVIRKFAFSTTFGEELGDQTAEPGASEPAPGQAKETVPE